VACDANTQRGRTKARRLDTNAVAGLSSASLPETLLRPVERFINAITSEIARTRVESPMSPATKVTWRSPPVLRMVVRKFVLRSALRPNQIEFSHSPGQQPPELCPIATAVYPWIAVDPRHGRDPRRNRGS